MKWRRYISCNWGVYRDSCTFLPLPWLVATADVERMETVMLTLMQPNVRGLTLIAAFGRTGGDKLTFIRRKACDLAGFVYSTSCTGDIFELLNCHEQQPTGGFFFFQIRKQSAHEEAREPEPEEEGHDGLEFEWGGLD